MNDYTELSTNAHPHPQMNPESQHPIQDLRRMKPPATLSILFLPPSPSLSFSSLSVASSFSPSSFLKVICFFITVKLAHSPFILSFHSFVTLLSASSHLTLSLVLSLLLAKL